MLPNHSARTVVIFSFLAFGIISCVADGDTSGNADDESALATSSEALRPAAKRLVNDVLLVHGAWADGSCWSGVIRVLQNRGFNLSAVQLREQSVADDAAIVRHAIDAVPRPLVVVGHSYGGFVISEASTGASNVSALVYVAAFAPDAGESIGMVSAPYPTTPAIMNLVVDDQGNATIEPNAFVRFFASDVPERDAKVLAAVQHPTAVGILSTAAGEPGWKTIPSYYQISLNDEVIDPALERMFADRMGAETIELDASHVSMISQPKAIAKLIGRAASAAK
jgi:pimeloyl-ACP methyl ester carboxylesterase